MDELSEIYLEASGGKYGDQKGIFAVRDHVIAEMKAKLDRAERASVPVKVRWDVSPEDIRVALAYTKHSDFVSLEQWYLDYLAAHAVIDAPAGVPSVDPPAAQVEALARVLDKWHVCTPTDGHYAIENSEGIFGGWRSHDGLEEICEIHNAAIAHLATRPEGLSTAEELDRIARDAFDANDGTLFAATHAILAALRPWLRDPVAFELDVHPDQLDLYKWVTEPDGGYAYAAQQAIDLCRSRIRPTYECDCSAIEKERDLLKVEYESRQIMINNVRAALEGRPFKNTLDGE